jgi:hypothetical protein
LIGNLIKARETHKGDEEEAIKSFTDGELKGTGGSLYSAGQDTTYSTETTFVMGMVLNPEVQSRAQKEVDAATGRARLPTFDDWTKVPIVERIIYETLRLVRIAIASWTRADNLADSIPLFRMVSLIPRDYRKLTYHTNRVGVPHKTLEEDFYRDMYIPKGKLYLGFGMHNE